MIEQNEEKQKDQQEYQKKLNEVKSQKKSGWFTSKQQKDQNQKEIEEFEKQLQESLKVKEQQIASEFE